LTAKTHKAADINSHSKPTEGWKALDVVLQESRGTWYVVVCV